MVKILNKYIATGVLLLSTLFTSGQEMEVTQPLEPAQVPNICNCFEYERGELSTPASIIRPFFNNDSILTLEVFWIHPAVVAAKLQYDQGILAVKNREYEIHMLEETMHNDSLLKVTYMIPELAYEEQAQPQMLLFSQLVLTYNRLINMDQGKCGQYYIPINHTSIVKED